MAKVVYRMKIQEARCLADEMMEELRHIRRHQIKHRALSVFAIPRGGQCALYVGMAVTDKHGNWMHVTTEPGTADVFVDDIVDTGATRKSYAGWGKPFVSMLDMTADPVEILRGVRFAASNKMRHKWVHFPWESERDLPVSEPTGVPTAAHEVQAQARWAVRRLLELLGEDVEREGLVDTPDRVWRMLQEVTSGRGVDVDVLLSKTFPCKHDEMVVLRGIEFASTCEHHLMPFTGTATVGYIPSTEEGGRVLGLSKLARVVDAFSRRLQIQEQLTDQIATAIQGALKPLGVGVVLRAHHGCMGCRGVRKPGAEMVTSRLIGKVREGVVRGEFLALAGIR